MGTLYNWLGRSPYVGDAYLSKTLLHDFRLYRKALTDEEIQLTELNVVTMLNNLDAAYLENPNPPVAVRNPMNTAIKVYGTPNGIRINGLTGVERVAVFDLSGRSIRVANASDITLKPGFYFIKVDNLVTKVLVH
ncbi:MAG: T9SS type A sorting domain-containing protein [Bacteroidales bacterium]|nr:T9SS type A sorting domain-containing protein [Bacteroidales bacterium]